MKKLTVFLTAFIWLYVPAVNAQQGVAINTTGSAADSKSILDVSSTTKGVLIPRMTAAQRIAIAPSASQNGLLVFDTDSSGFIFWTGNAWQKINGTGSSGGDEWVRSGNDIFNTNMGNVGIATNNPKVPFHVAENKIVLFGKDTSGGGSRLMWVPSKYAFRVGLTGPAYNVGGGEYDYGDPAVWDYDSVGYFSVAGGFSNKAKGNASTAFGGYNEAQGQFSVALGSGNASRGHFSFSAGAGSVATGFGSVSLGQHAKSLSDNAVALGNYVEASGASSFATGYISKATGTASMATGYNSLASGNYSTAMGYETRAVGDYSFANGFQSEATGFYAMALGRNTQAIGNSAFASGYLTNATGHYAVALGRGTEAIGSNSFAAGYLSEAAGNYATATGRNTHASGDYAYTIGANTSASGNYSVAAGYNSRATGLYSVSIGQSNAADGDNTFAAGTNTHANGIYSTAFGLETIANSRSSFVIGRYNDSVAGSNPYTWVATDPLFIIGNGYANDNRNNVLTVLKNGKFGFGTNNPAANLHVKYNSSPNNPQLLLEETTTDLARLLFKNSNSWGNWTIAGFVQPDGDFNSNARLFFDFSGFGHVFHLRGNGDAGLTGTLFNTSDERFKKNITPLTNSVRKLMQVSAYTYQWKDIARGNEEQIGFLAQEVEKQFPQLVRTDEEGMKSVSYLNMVPVLLQAIKEQQQQLDQQQGQILELKKLLGTGK